MIKYKIKEFLRDYKRSKCCDEGLGRNVWYSRRNVEGLRLNFGLSSGVVEGLRLCFSLLSGIVKGLRQDVLYFKNIVKCLIPCVYNFGRCNEGLRLCVWLNALVFILLSSGISAQTIVEKVVPTKASGEGIMYYLPRTSFIINAEITKISVKAGTYYKYAERYLGIKGVATEDKVYYELGAVTLENKGVADVDKKYRIEFRQKTVAPFVYLTSDGLLCAINEEYTPEKKVSEVRPEPKTATESPSSVFSEELLLAGSIAKQAEIAAKQIHHLRDSRTDILTGDADNLPPDGEAMKIVISKLEEQEKELTKLFTGSELREKSYFDISILPDDELDREVLFRFSSKLGILDDNDLGGEPVYINVFAIERAPDLELKEAEKKAKMMLKGVIYNVPGKARVEIVYNNKTICKKETPFVQFGTQEALAPIILEDKKQPVKVTFYPETGAIKQITK